MDQSGKITHVSGRIDGTDYPKSKPIIDLLKRNFRQEARDKRLKATGIVSDVRIRPPGGARETDPIQICLEHQDGYAAKVLFPYTIKDGELIFGLTFAHKGEMEIFGRK